MTRVLLDTNIWLRLFTLEPSSQFESCKKLFTRIEIGNFHPYISNIILLELAYTLKTFYKLKPNMVVRYLETVLQTRNLTIIEKTNSKQAYELHKKTKIKFSDCLIATQVKPGLTIITYDQDFVKLLPQQTKKPEVLSV